MGGQTFPYKVFHDLLKLHVHPKWCQKASVKFKCTWHHRSHVTALETSSEREQYKVMV